MFASHGNIAVLFASVVLLLSPSRDAHADAISVHMGANSDPGDAAAGVVPAAHWNNTSLGFSDLAVHDSSGAVVPGLTITESTTFGAFTSSEALAAFPGAADMAMMGSLNYVGLGGAKPALRVTFSGTLPYQVFDLYVYAHSGKIGTYTQDIMVLSGTGGDLGLNKIAKDIDGKAESYGEASATVSGDYVVFRGISRDQVGSKFIVQAGGGIHSGEYGTMNGIQIVDATPASTKAASKLSVTTRLGAGMWALLGPLFRGEVGFVKNERVILQDP